MLSGNQILAASLVGALWVMLIFGPSMQRFAPMLPHCTYIAWGACVLKSGVVRTY